jgi:hypothetical protein
MIGIVTRLPISVATAKIPVAVVGSTQSWIAKIRSSPDKRVAVRAMMGGSSDDRVGPRAMIAGTGMTHKRMAFSLVEVITAGGLGCLLDRLL